MNPAAKGRRLQQRAKKASDEMITLSDLSWTAGFLEGEGCFFVNRRCPGVTATQVQLWPLRRLLALFGGSLRLQRRQHLNANHRDAYAWEIQGSFACGLMMTIYPLVSPERQKQICRALVLWKSANVGARYRHACPQGHQYSMTWVDARGRTHRGCTLCRREANRRYDKTRRARTC